MPADDCIEVAREQRATFASEFRADDGDDRHVRVSFSSEAPVARSYGLEILGHGPGEVDLSGLTSGRAPLLSDHRADLDHQVGTIVSAEIVGNRGQAIVRFGKSARAAEILARVRDGEVGSVSVGYRVDAMRSDGERDGQPVYRATKWTPLEISLVSIPADGTVGVGREAGNAGTIIIRKAQTMPQTIPATPAAPGNNAARAERTRVTEVMAIGRHAGMPAEAVDRAIEDSVPLDEFRKIALEYLGSRDAASTSAGATRVALGLGNFGGPSDQRRVLDASPVRAVQAQLTGDWSGAGLEREISQEYRSHMGRSPEGVYIAPWSIVDRRRFDGAMARRDMLSSSNTGQLIGIEHMHGAFIDALTPNVAVLAAGATTLPGLVQDVSIPRQTSTSVAEWIAEGSAATESTPTFDNVTLSPKHLSATVRFTRKMLKQSLPALDGIMRKELREEVARKLDAAAINGAGTPTVPRGILNDPGVHVYSLGADGGAPTWADVVALVGEVESADAAAGGLGWLTNSAVKHYLMTVKRDAGSGIFALDEAHGGKMAGYPMTFSNLVPRNLTQGISTDLSALIFGNWSDLLIGQWGGMDLIVDNVTESPQGNVRLTIHSEWDIAVRHPESFAVMKDLDTNI